MSLADAQRKLRWQVVMDALADANVDAETIKMVEYAQSVDDVVHTMACALVGGADAKQAKNYIKIEMVGFAAPFERAYVELVRPDGKTSHELRELLRDRLYHVRRLLLEGCPTDGLRMGILEGINETLKAESP